jgi:hypothetical protein
MRGKPVTALIVLLLCTYTAAAAERMVVNQGLRMEQALDLLRARGLRVVYSSVLVPDTLTVVAEAAGDDPVAVAREILKPHGLRLRSLSPGLVAIVADRVGPRWKLVGRVIALSDQKPISGARVEIAGQNYVAWTGSDGGFSIPVSGVSARTIRISAVGFDAVAKQFPHQPLASEPNEIQLSAAATTLEQVTVVASRFSYQDTTTNPFVLDQASIIAQPKIGEDALQAVARLPGMAFSGVSGKPNVRGGESGETLVLLDGMPIREAFHLPDYNSAFSVLDENLVMGLTTYTGPLPARFGNRLSAVMELESVAADSPARRALALSSFNARVRIGSTAGEEQRLSWLASGRVGTLGKWLSKATPDLGQPSSKDVFLKTEYRLPNGGQLRAQALLTSSVFDFLDAETGETAALESDTAYTWLTARKELAENVSVGALLGHSWINSRRSGVLTGGLTPHGAVQDDRAARIFDAQVYGDWQFSERHRLEGGIALASSRGKYRYASDVEYVPAAALFAVPPRQTRNSNARAERDIVGLHLQDRWQVAKNWYVEAGARLDRDLAAADVRGSYFSPRLAVRWNIGPLTTLRASWGRAFQAAEAYELRVEDNELSLPAAQRIDQRVLSLEHLLTNGLTLRIEGFERRIPNPRTRYENIFDPLRLLPELSADRIAISPDSSRMRGLEASAQWEKGPWSLWGAYTWSEAIDNIDGEQVLRDWDQRSTLSTALSWRSGPWSIALQSAYRSGRPTTPFLSEALESAVLGVRNSARFAAHMSVDARVSRRFQMGPGTLIAFAQVTNLFDRANRCCLELDLPDETSNPLALEIQPLRSYPLVPALGVSYEF